MSASEDRINNDTYWVRIKDKGIHATGTLPLAIYKAALFEANK